MPGASSGSGVAEAVKKLKQFLKKQEIVPAEVMQQAAADLKQEIINETPYKSGKLEETVYVHVVKAGNDRTTLSAGANAYSRGYNYAQIQHDVETFQHPIKGKAFYVRDPFERATEKIITSITEMMQY